tara:strand:+ start:7536 stop:8048 length:513 start_codon:yes stop_codon:yes gene_type:complete
LGQLGSGANWPSDQLASAVRAAQLQLSFATVAAEGAFERADQRFIGGGGKVAVTAFAVRAQLQHGRLLERGSGKAFAVCLRADCQVFMKGAAQIFWVAETGQARHCVDRRLGVLQQVARGFQVNSLNAGYSRQAMVLGASMGECLAERWMQSALNAMMATRPKSPQILPR